MSRRLVLTAMAVVMAACSNTPAAAPPTGPSSPGPSVEASAFVPTPGPSVDTALLESHEAACQAADEAYVAEGGTSSLDGTDRLLVLQTFDRPIHAYSDGERFVLCVARAGTDPDLGQFSVAELAATRLELATANNLPPLDLVTPLVCRTDLQYGVFTACWGSVDPIVAAATFTVPGGGQVDAVLGNSPPIAIGDASSDVVFLAQWEGDEIYESWTASDSCGAVLGNIVTGEAPTPCPPRR